MATNTGTSAWQSSPTVPGGVQHEPLAGAIPAPTYRSITDALIEAARKERADRVMRALHVAAEKTGLFRV